MRRVGKAVGAAAVATTAIFLSICAPERGRHKFSVRAVDLVGQTDPIPASRSFRVEL